MRFIQISLLSILLVCGLSSAKSRYKALPPGTVRLTDSLFIDKFPVKVRDYVEFLNSIRTFYTVELHDSLKKMPKFGLTEEDIYGLRRKFKGDSVEYVRMLTRTWITYADDERRYDVDYHIKSTRYYDYPIVNITFEQMRHYCRWRTDMVMLYYAVKCKTEKQRRKYPWNFVYRLVKRKEWEKALGEYFYDIKRRKKKLNNNQPDNVIAPYLKEKGRDFYYDVDNAAETLDKQIVTFNFKWTKSLGLGDISYFKYTGPADWISFRCICEVLPEETPIVMNEVKQKK